MYTPEVERKLRQVLSTLGSQAEKRPDIKELMKKVFRNKCEFGVFGNVIAKILGSKSNFVVVNVLNYENLFDYANLFSRASKLPYFELPKLGVKLKIIPVITFPFTVDIMSEVNRAINSGAKPMVVFSVLEFFSFDTSALHLQEYRDIVYIITRAINERDVYAVIFTTNPVVITENIPICRYAVIIEDPAYEAFKEFCPEKAEYAKWVGFTKVARYPEEKLKQYLTTRKLPTPHTIKPVSRDVAFDELVLPDSIKEFIRLNIISVLRQDPMALPSILLIGPRGSGKTTIGCAIASAVGLSAYTVHVELMMSKWLGESEKIANQTVMMVNELSPAVAVFRDIELLIGERKGTEEAMVYERIKSIIMSWVRSPRRRFFAVFTASDPRHIPEHALQDPTFGVYKIPILPPLNAESRKKMLSLFLRKLSQRYNLQFDPARKDVDEALTFVAQKTALFTARELHTIAEIAVRLAKDKGLSAVTKEAIQLAKKYLEIDRITRAELVRAVVNACKKVGMPEALEEEVHRLEIEVERLVAEVYAEEAKRKGLVAVSRK